MTLLAALLACSTVPAPDAPLADAPAAHQGHHEGHDGHADHDATVRHRFDDAEHWSKVFDDPARDAWQRPEVVVARLGLAPGQVVADLGAGTGYFEPHLAKAVGPEGKVIAVDIEPNLVTHLAERATRDGTPQVEARLGAPDDPKLAAGEVDRVLMVDTYHHIDDRVAWFGRLKSTLRPGGSLWIVDFDPEVDTDQGPPKEHRLSPATVTGELQAAGWAPIEGPADDELPNQYQLGFSPR